MIDLYILGNTEENLNLDRAITLVIGRYELEGSDSILREWHQNVSETKLTRVGKHG